MLQVVLMLAILALLCSHPPGVLADQSIEEQVPGLFKGFTSYIAQQVENDKREFLQAQICTQWFYKQLRPKPSTPSIEPIAYDTEGDCAHRFPEGITGARNELSRTQASLSVSLTFYEFALVGDRDDDGRYSESELHDMLDAFGVSSGFPAQMVLGTLNNKFDAIRQHGGLDVLMTSMASLYDKGYRFTDHDRKALDRVMG
jgi:hypothetical protein